MNGIYIHIPYCVKKCGYCDFYSICDLSSVNDYVSAVCDNISKIDCLSDTLYIGGGTPSLLDPIHIARIVNSTKPILIDDAEITVEVNPGDDMKRFIPTVCKSGVNRLSIGMQSHNDHELKMLTRRHNSSDVDKTIEIAKECGIVNISLDVMIGIEGQTIDSLKETLDYCASVGATHISAYMLKIETGTPFERATFRPVDDLQADMYLFAVDYLAELGYKQYEISNFCRSDMYSRHNLKYWTNESYIGIGAAAHSYYNGCRYYYSRSIKDFVAGIEPIQDGIGGNFEESVMLGLRLVKGIDCNELTLLYPDEKFKISNMLKTAENLSESGLLILKDNIISLTPKGFLVSNSIINVLLD